MTTFYLDASAVGNEYQTYTDVPTTWAVPQDGSGLGSDPTTAAVAVAEVTFAAIPTSGACSVFGVTVTLTGVLSAASTAACATALASSINATVTATGVAVCQALLPLNRFCYARVKPGGGANDSIVQIMSRIAGADLNYNAGANTSARVTNTFNLSAMTSPVDFAGGAHGPFGYFWNVSAAAFGKTGGSNAIPAWGLGPSKAPGPSEPGNADWIIARTKRGAANITLAHSTNTNNSYTICPAGTHRHLLFDNGTTWAAGGVFSLEITAAQGSGSNFLNWSGSVSLHAEAQYGFRLWHSNTSAQTLGLTALAAGMVSCENCLFEESILAPNLGSIVFTAAAAGTTASGISQMDCKWIAKTGARILATGNGSGAAATAVHITYEQCLFEYGAAASTGIVSLASNQSIGDLSIEFLNCYFYDRNSIVNPVVTSPITGTVFPAGGRIVFEGCVGVAPFSSGLSASIARINSQVAYMMPGVDGEWRVESGGWVSEWRAGANIPYLTGLLPSGTPWSLKVLLRELADDRIQLRIATLNQFYRSASAAKTITVEMLVPTGVSFKKTRIGLEITYTKTDGTTAREDTFEPLVKVVRATETSIATSTAPWNLNGSSGLDKVSLSITTANAILTGTLINIRVVHRGRPPGNVDRILYIDPEPALT